MLRWAGDSGERNESAMNYPIPETRRAQLLPPLAGLSVVLMALTGGGLNSRRTPLGIVDLELAGTECRAREVLEEWGPAGRRRARNAVRLDFFFLLVYSTAIGLACTLAAARLSSKPGLARAGVLLAWLQWGAALLDAVENAALLRMLRGAVRQPWPRIARGCALPKFAIVGLGLTYAAYGRLAGSPRRSYRLHQG